MEKEKQEQLENFISQMNAKRFVQIHVATFRNHYLSSPDDLDSYNQQHNLGDAEDFFYDIDGFLLVVDKTREFLETLNDKDKVSFFGEAFTIEEIELDLYKTPDPDLQEDFNNFYGEYPWSDNGYDVFIYEIHKEFIMDKAQQRDNRIEEIFEDKEKA